MRIKKLICILFVAALLFTIGPAMASTNEGGDDFYTFTGLRDESVSYRVVPTAADVNLSMDAAAAILVERETGTILYEENADVKRPIASITKVMTMILTMEALEAGKISLNDPVVTSDHAYSMGGSQIWLEPGEIMTVDELLRAVAVQSANDAAVALGEHVAGSEEAFVVLMNERAAQLGMTNTVFRNACGLDEEGHLSTARDVALMSRECLRHDLVREYVTIWQDHLRGGETELTNTNKMLRSFTGMTGLKTGTTSKAGVCVTASAEREGMELIAVVLGSSNSKSRFAAARTMLEYGFANYELAQVGLKPADFSQVKITLGELQYCEYLYEVPESVVVERGKAGSISYTVEMSEKVSAPVEQGQQLGEIIVYSEGVVIGVYPIVSTMRVEKLEFGSAFDMLWRSLLRL